MDKLGGERGRIIFKGGRRKNQDEETEKESRWGQEPDSASRQSMAENQCGLPLKGLGRYQREVSMGTFIAALSTIVKTWNQPRCPWTDEQMKRIWCVYTIDYCSIIEEKHDRINQRLTRNRGKKRMPQKPVGRLWGWMSWQMRVSWPGRRWSGCFQGHVSRLNTVWKLWNRTESNAIIILNKIHLYVLAKKC